MSYNPDQPRDDHGRWDGGSQAPRMTGDTHTDAVLGNNPGQTMQYYHGSGANRPRIQSLDPEFDKNLFVSNNRVFAEGYGPNISTVTPQLDAKILHEGTPEFERLARGGLSSADTVRSAKQAGYDAVHFANQKNLGTAIMNRNKFIIK